jgi:hypothetical protein
MVKYEDSPSSSLLSELVFSSYKALLISSFENPRTRFDIFLKLHHSWEEWGGEADLFILAGVEAGDRL